MIFDHTKLFAKIEKEGFSKEQFARKLGISRSSFYNKVFARSSFSQVEIIKMTRILRIPKNQIVSYFFEVLEG